MAYSLDQKFLAVLFALRTELPTGVKERVLQERDRLRHVLIAAFSPNEIELTLGDFRYVAYRIIGEGERVTGQEMLERALGREARAGEEDARNFELYPELIPLDTCAQSVFVFPAHLIDEGQSLKVWAFSRVGGHWKGYWRLLSDGWGSHVRVVSRV